MHRNLGARALVLAAFGLGLLGCDTLVTTSYRGESRLSLPVRVENSPTSSTESIVPVLAHVNDQRVSFRRVEMNGSYPANFNMEVVEAPRGDRLPPLDPWLAPHVLVAQEYVAAVVDKRLEQGIDLRSKYAPIHQDCWNGSCDVQPRPDGVPLDCAPNDRECIRRSRNCPNGRCFAAPARIDLPDGLQDILGFAREYVLLYVPERVPEQTWAALRLGAPAGLGPGFHLAQLRKYSADLRTEANLCFDAAHEEVLERFNAEHETELTDRALDCLRAPVQSCETVPLPARELSPQLAAAIAAAELEHGCLELTPEMVPVTDASERITVRMGQAPPGWVPGVLIWRSHIGGTDP